MNARDELIRYVEDSPKPTRPGLSGLIALVEKEAREKAPVIQLAAIAKPGDTVMVGMDLMVTDEEHQVLRERYQPLLDDGIKVFLVEHCTALTVVRPESVATTACPYTMAHTREFCGNPGCRES